MRSSVIKGIVLAALLGGIELTVGVAVASPPVEKKAEPHAAPKGPAAPQAPSPPQAPSTPSAGQENLLPGRVPPINAIVTPAPGARRKTSKSEDGPPAPMLTISALRDEIKRGGSEEDRPGSRKNRERLEQLTKDIAKAREGLRQDAARLESLMAMVSGADDAEGADQVDGGKKKPTPLEQLAKSMRGMKPEQAAPIVARVDKKLAADILQRMPPADAGKVMGQLKPEVAAELAAEIASRSPRAEAKR